MTKDDPSETAGDDYVDLRELDEGTSFTLVEFWPAGSSRTSVDPVLMGAIALCALLLVIIGLINIALSLLDIYLIITPS